MDEATRRTHRLLSDGKLSGPEIEEILDNLNAAGRRRQARKKVRALPYWAGSAAAVAAAALLFFVVPRGEDTHGRVPEEGEVAGLEVRCSGGTLDACPASSKLVFLIAGNGAAGFLSAYADLRGHDPMRVFLYSKEDGSPELPVQPASRPLGLRGPARWQIHAVLADRALTRAEVVEVVQDGRRGAGAGIRATVKVEIVVKE